MRAALLVVAACAAPHRVHRVRARPCASGWFARLANGRTSDASFARVELATPVVVREVAVVDRPGGLPTGIYLEPGYPLDATVASWLHVHAERPIAVDGWVPVAARGLYWRPAPFSTVGRETESISTMTIVHADPDDASGAIAVLDAGVFAAVTARFGAWSQIDAFAGNVRVLGWARLPPRPARTFEFDDDVIEGELVNPAACSRGPS